MLGEADQGLTQQALGANQPNPRYQGDENLFVQFHFQPVKDKEKSLEEGRDIYVDKDYVTVMIPGDKDNVIIRPIQDSDKERFPRQWAAFKNREDQPVEGTPLSEWPGISRSHVEELKFFNVFTVEALAAMPDSAVGKFMGVGVLKEKAKAYVDASKGNAPMDKLRAENEQLKDQMAAMQDQIEQLIEGSKSKKGK